MHFDRKKPESPAVPLYVDLDGTLIATDLLRESALRLLRDSPSQALMIPRWLRQGRAVLKANIAARVNIDVTNLPYRQEVLELIDGARARGSRVVLATASDRKFAEQVADHLGRFDAVLASDGNTNCTGLRKLEAIKSDAGGLPFDYAGDRDADLPIWQAAQGAVVVSASEALKKRVASVTRVSTVIRPAAAGLKDYLYGIRLHQWLKNLLVFLPLLPVLKSVHSTELLHAVAAFVAFGLMASGVYLLNDLLDIEADRRHYRKRLRPFASGVIGIPTGLALAGTLLITSIAFSVLALSSAFLLILCLYFLLTTCYSLVLKRLPVVDVFALAGLYAIRIVAGAIATGLPISLWIITFSLFIFLSLALAKRYVELSNQASSEASKLMDRGYIVSDKPYVMSTGIAAGQLSVLLLSLYLSDKEIVQRYTNPKYLWALLPMLLFWVSRVWFKALRLQLHDDPVVFAAKDAVSRITFLGAATIVWLAA